MDELDDPTLPAIDDRLIWKYSVPGRWHRFKVRFMRRSKKRFMLYGIGVGILAAGALLVIIL